MPSQRDLELHSKALDKIRSDLRKHLDKCILTTARASFTVSYEAPFILTPSEETAMKRQLDASHGDALKIDVSFTTIKPRRRPVITKMEIGARRKRVSDGRRNQSI